MPLPEMTPERRAAIARLCGGKFLTYGCAGDRPVAFRFQQRDFSQFDWLQPKTETDELIQESILLRGLVRAGVLHGVRVVRFNGNPDVFVADPKTSWWGNDKGVPTTGATPLAAMVALANAHLDALETAERLDRSSLIDDSPID